MDEEAKEHRKRELEERRKQLELMRSRRATRSKDKEAQLRRDKENKEEADRKLVQEIIKQAPTLPPPPPSVAANAAVGEGVVGSNEKSQRDDNAADSSGDSVYASPRRVTLGVQVGLAEVHVVPLPKETYSQACQTDFSLTGHCDSPNGVGSDASPFDPLSPATPNRSGSSSGISPRTGVGTPDQQQRSRRVDFTTAASSPSGGGPGLVREGVGADGAESLDDSGGVVRLTPRKPKLSAESLAAIEASGGFAQFVELKAKVLERALGEAVLFDATADFYSAAPTTLLAVLDGSKKEEEEGDAAEGQQQAGGGGERLGGVGGSLSSSTVASLSLSADSVFKAVARFDLTAAAAGLAPGSLLAGGGGGGGLAGSGVALAVGSGGPDFVAAAVSRPVSDLKWSPHRPEVVAASFGAAPSLSPGAGGGGGGDAASSDGGLVLLWSLALAKRPERVLTCHSPVLSLLLPQDSPHLVVGGTYSGQVVVWDTRKRSSLPVRRSGLAPCGGGASEKGLGSSSDACSGHTHPVYSLAARPPPVKEKEGVTNGGQTVAAAASASSNLKHERHGWSLVSASSDGLVCEWDPAALLSPTERLQLSYLPSTHTSSSSSMSSNPQDTTTVAFSSAAPPSSGGAALLPVSVSSLGLLRGCSRPATDGGGIGGGGSGVASPGVFCDAICVGTESGDLFLANLDGSFSSSLKKEGSGGSGGRGVLRSKLIGGQGSTQGRSGDKAHYGMVTQVALHPDNWRQPQKATSASASSSLADFTSPHNTLASSLRSGLVLTAGLDWATRLWAIDRTSSSSSSSGGQPPPRGTGRTQTEEGAMAKAVQLCEFRGAAYEQVSDVCWSPTNPALFATAHGGVGGGGGGHLSLWDLCHSTEDPKVSLPLTPLLGMSNGGSSGSGSGAPLSATAATAAAAASSSSLSKMAWSPDGRRLALGDLDGRVHVLALANDVADPKTEVEDDLDRVLRKLNTQALATST